MQPNRNLFIVIGVLLGVLMLLVTLSLLFRSAGSTKVDESKITPIPRLDDDSTTSPQEMQNAQERSSRFIKNTNTLSRDQQNKLQNLSRKMPVTNPDFDMDYSSFLNEFFIEKKTAEAQKELDEYLKDNDAASLVAARSDLFTISDQSTEEQIQEAESQAVALLDAETQAQLPSSAKDVELFSDLLKTLLTFDLGTSTTITIPEGTAPITGSTQSCTVGTDLGDAATYQGGTIHLCRVQGITVNSTIAENVNNLLNAARNQGRSFGGSGFRSYTTQVALRRSHCGTSNYDIYQKPSSQCSPPTARPGTSMHEQGLAIDFTYQQRLITSRSNQGFIWLSQNASKYGLINFPKEPWHWSVNGR